jgi:hypothetical protein
VHRRRPSVLVSAIAAAVLAVGPASPIHPASAQPGDPAERPPHAATLTFGFNANAYTIRTLDPTQWPYYTTTVIPLVDTGSHDEFGVRMFNVGGVLYNHPVAQAQYALANIHSFLATSDPTYLARAEAQAQRLIETAVPSRNAIYFPYPFNHARHGVAADTLVAPWYSAMAQGQALTVFVRLFELTANEAYRTAAVSTFNSFLNPRASGVPWTVFVDASGYLWLEEYPAAVPDRTYNGLTFALYGLWDYHRVTGDADALQLLRGALTTVAKYFPNVRYPNWIARYCLAHGTLSAFYHQVVIHQQMQLYTMTADVTFARNADLLFNDYPYPTVSGSVRFVAGAHTGYKFNSSGAVTATKTASLIQPSSAPFSSRKRIFNRGVYYLITAGVWSGYWIPEVPNRSYAYGVLPIGVNYVPPRLVTFAVGSHTGYAFAPSGAVTGTKTVTFTRPSNAAADKRVVINGVQYVRMFNGTWAGMYIPVSTRISM